MAKKTPFTPEQIFLLEQNPFTYSVTPNGIRFTKDFKQFFYDQITINKLTTRKALAAAGYDLTLFSVADTDYIRRKILAEAKTGFTEPRGKSKAEYRKDLSKKKQTEIQIQEMQERIEHLEAQIEFLKKISFLKNHPERQ